MQQHLHELEIENIDSLDFAASFAIESLYQIIQQATEHMRMVQPNDEHMVFIRVPICAGS